ncbi:ankyrin repeat domain-containing protein [Wolbachia pipientis]|uniref:ankyrin repeat domain-containing protein n=1 Tax=Wolbachia pipientis TaxID=955 RepID=UPI00034A1366|nr:ankyrin repeat domain-containing protein [Wolbachia pipientis]
MTINFSQYVEGEKLSLSSPSHKTIEERIEEMTWTKEKKEEAQEELRKKEEQYHESLSELINFLQSNNYITELEFKGSFSFYSPIKTLAQSSCLQNLRKLVLPRNLHARDLKALAQSPHLQNIRKLDLPFSHIDAEGVKALAQSPHLQNLRELNLSFQDMNVENVKALVQSPYLKNLEKLSIENIIIDCKTIEAIAELCDPRIELDVLCSDPYQKFYHFLLNRKCFTMDEKDIKEMIMDLAPRTGSGRIITHILKNPDKYPFLINSRDEQEHTLAHFYTHNPEMQNFLFERGMIPEKVVNQEREDERIAQDNQSVHASPIVKRTKFFTKKLVESTKANKEQLKQAAASYVESIELLKQYQNNPIRLRLLSLTDNEKRSVMEKTLHNSDSTPNDKEFIKTVIDKAEQVLVDKYLEKNEQGEYAGIYSTSRMQYDYARDDAKITIPESIGYIKLLIDNFPIPLKEKKELLVTLAEQNPELVKQKLSSIKSELENDNISQEQITNRAKFHKLLDNVNDDKVNKLFEEISGLDIEKVWREQKEFVLLRQIYIAATTYGDNSSACIQGTWSQIISSINEISSEIVIQYNHYLEEEQRLEAQKDVIKEENIKPFLEGLAEKLIQYVELHPELKGTLEEFAVSYVDIGNPEKITFEQQKILAEINKYFSENIKNVLPNYNRNIPNRDEYYLIITGLPEVEVMRRFAEPIQSPFDAKDNNSSYTTISTDEEFQDAADQELFKLQTGKMETQIDISKTSMDLFTRGESNSRTTDAITNFSTAKIPALEQESDKNEQATTQLTGYVIQEDFIQVLQPKSLVNIRDNNIQIVDEITQVAEINPDERTSLHDAAEIGDTEGVNALVKEKDINARDRYGRTPLHYAASKGHTEILRSLLDAGAKFDEKDNVGMTPLCLAIVNDYQEIVETLVEKGANVNVVSKSGKTPLEWLSISRHTWDDLCSSNCSHTEIKEILLKNGAVQGHVISSDDEYEQDEQKKLSDSNLSEIQLYAKPITIETPFVASKDPDQVSDTQGNSKQSSDPNQNNPALQNMKRSKLPVIAASVIIIPGVALGVAIAVHLEMLAVGIAVGVFCSVVAGIAYRLNRPVSAFEGNNIQELPNNALVPYKRTKDVAGSIACGVLRPSDNECLDKSQKSVVNSPKSQNKVHSQISDQEPKITIPQHLAEENLKESESKADTNVKLTENSLKPNVVQQSTKIGNYFEFTDNELLFVITNKNYTFLEAQCKNKDIPEEFRVFVECKSGKFIITGSYNSQQSVGDEKKSVSITSVKKYNNMGLSGDPRSRLEMMNKLELYEIGKFLEVTEISDKSLITPKMKQSHTTSNPQMVNNTTIDQATSSAVTNEYKEALVNTHEEKPNSEKSKRESSTINVFNGNLELRLADDIQQNLEDYKHPKKEGKYRMKIHCNQSDFYINFSKRDNDDGSVSLIINMLQKDKRELCQVAKMKKSLRFKKGSTFVVIDSIESFKARGVPNSETTNLEAKHAYCNDLLVNTHKKKGEHNTDASNKIVQQEVVDNEDNEQEKFYDAELDSDFHDSLDTLFIPEGAKLEFSQDLSDFLSRARSLEIEKLFCKVIPNSLLFQSREERLAINGQSVDAQ